MTTREEQIEKALEIARLNPEWVLIIGFGRPALEGPEKAAAVFAETWRGGYWEAYQGGSFYPIRGRSKGVSRFRSPAAAIRALGFDVKEEGVTDRRVPKHGWNAEELGYERGLRDGLALPAAERAKLTD